MPKAIGVTTTAVTWSAGDGVYGVTLQTFVLSRTVHNHLGTTIYVGTQTVAASLIAGGVTVPWPRPLTIDGPSKFNLCSAAGATIQFSLLEHLSSLDLTFVSITVNNAILTESGDPLLLESGVELDLES